MAEASDFFPDDGIGPLREGIDAAMPSSDLCDDGVLATSKVKSLQQSFTRCQEFINYEQVHTIYLESLHDIAEIQRATLEYDSRLQERLIFSAC